MVINGANIIGNVEDFEDAQVCQPSSMPDPSNTGAMINTMMEGEDENVPSSLIPPYTPPTKHSSVKTRKERKGQNQVMKEAEKRTQESLERIITTGENNPNQKS